MKLLSVPGQIVTLSANQEHLFYIYHRAQGFEGEQYLSCGTISSKRSNKKRGPQTLPQEIGLSSGSQLSWAGFTDEGTPATYDTKGIVRIGKLERMLNLFFLSKCLQMSPNVCQMSSKPLMTSIIPECPFPIFKCPSNFIQCHSMYLK